MPCSWFEFHGRCASQWMFLECWREMQWLEQERTQHSLSWHGCSRSSTRCTITIGWTETKKVVQNQDCGRVQRSFASIVCISSKEPTISKESQKSTTTHDATIWSNCLWLVSESSWREYWWGSFRQDVMEFTRNAASHHWKLAWNNA